MAPTIQTGGIPAEKRQQRPVAAEKKSELIAKVKYCNTLPDIPFDLKFITYPFDNERFIQYNPTSLERNYRYEVLTEHDLGVTIDLINRDLYQSDSYAQLDPADEKLLEEDTHTPQDSMRSKHHAKSVSWLRKSEYISTEQTRFQPQTMEKVEAKVGFNVKKSFVEETLYMDRDTQIKAIEKTFEDSKKDIKQHYSKPNVTAVEILPFFPDFINWKHPCAQVIFDSDPAQAGKNIPAQIEEMSQAMIRGVMDESGEQFVAYFLPTDETMEKRRKDLANDVAYDDDEEYEYNMAREYNWNVKSKASKGYEENYFLVMRQDGVYYNELETRVRLNKRRQKVGQPQTNTKLVVRHIPLNAAEYRMQRYREKQLEPVGDEDEEEAYESSEEEAQEENAVETKNDENEKKEEEVETAKRISRSRSRSRTRSRSNQRDSRSKSKSPAGKLIFCSSRLQFLFLFIEKEARLRQNGHLDLAVDRHAVQALVALVREAEVLRRTKVHQVGKAEEAVRVQGLVVEVLHRIVPVVQLEVVRAQDQEVGHQEVLANPVVLAEAEVEVHHIVDLIVLGVLHHAVALLLNEKTKIIPHLHVIAIGFLLTCTKCRNS
ncbi:RNA polymerase II-associated factor 1 like [Pseudolycoriella hygida]|uniref:RNA polymerase II-associated factor 1 homolog n=1 Tax=Pseudolycoriella hygida TaxID=35572 RepID=A0A9Q0S047_9DIPT|nr:RNA polymerase II-associated factor 1 like [Pseudolycoriella hygida]